MNQGINMKKYSIVVFILIGLTGIGCRTMHGLQTGISQAIVGSKTHVYQVAPFPDISERLSDPQKCRIYLIRNTYVGAAFIDEIHDNKRMVGTLHAYTYLCWERDPGILTLECEEYGVNVPGKKTRTFNVEKGNVYFIKRTMWFSGDMKLISEEKGRKYLEECIAPDIKNPQ